MTELSFLLELLLNHKLPKATQLAIKDRIGSLDDKRPTAPVARVEPLRQQEIQAVASPQAAQALAQRQQLMDQAGTIQPGAKSPRKF